MSIGLGPLVFSAFQVLSGHFSHDLLEVLSLQPELRRPG